MKGSQSRLHQFLVFSLGAIGGLIVLAESAAASEPECFGQPATIVGSGLIHGATGDDTVIGDIRSGEGDPSTAPGNGNDLLIGGDGDDFLVGDRSTPSGDLVADGRN